jgi:hypothetical protein
MSARARVDRGCVAAGGGSLPFGAGLATPVKLLGLATWGRHKGPCEHVKRLEAEANASRADYHRGVLGKIRSLAQAVERALTDRERSCCSGGVYQDRHPSRRVLIGTWLLGRRWAHLGLFPRSPRQSSGCSRSNGGDRHRSMLAALQRAVKLSADKRGSFVLPRSREARVRL